MNQIKGLAIHDLERRDGGFSVVLADKELPVNETTQRVVDELYELYKGRASKSHGKFTSADGYPTESYVVDFIRHKSIDFLAFTHKMMANLEIQAGRKSASTGGYVFFARFLADKRDYLLVAIVNDKLGAALTSNLQMQSVKHLDLDGFRFAGRINLTGWAAREERYVSFLKGKGNVSEYFQEFLGCDSVVQDRKDTSDLVASLKDYAAAEKMNEVDTAAFLGKAKVICETYSRQREELAFEALANELLPKAPAKLVTWLAHPDRKLNDGFVPDRRALKSLVRLKSQTPAWSVEFDREALNRGPVRFNKKDNSLTLLDLPDEFVHELRTLVG